MVVNTDGQKKKTYLRSLVFAGRMLCGAGALTAKGGGDHIDILEVEAAICADERYGTTATRYMCIYFLNAHNNMNGIDRASITLVLFFFCT